MPPEGVWVRCMICWLMGPAHQWYLTKVEDPCFSTSRSFEEMFKCLYWALRKEYSKKFLGGLDSIPLSLQMAPLSLFSFEDSTITWTFDFEDGIDTLFSELPEFLFKCRPMSESLSNCQPMPVSMPDCLPRPVSFLESLSESLPESQSCLFFFCWIFLILPCVSYYSCSAVFPHNASSPVLL